MFKLQVKNCHTQNLVSKQASLLLILCLPLLVSLSSCTVLNSWLTESEQVAREEFSPRVALRKYEWFKDTAAELDRKRADISVMQKSLGELERSYAGTLKTDWAESDHSKQAQVTAELNGLRSSYNDLTAQYNADTAKINFTFANVGQLPEGTTEPLPRDAFWWDSKGIYHQDFLTRGQIIHVSYQILRINANEIRINFEDGNKG